MTTTIVQKGHPTLTQKATLVAVSDIGSKPLQRVIADMKEALHSQKDGAAIAAPQIGKPLRIFVVAKHVLDKEDVENDLVFINPELLKLSRKKELMDEGCLSVRGYYGTVRRAKRATVRAYNEQGELFERGAGGLLAQIFQHEIDHLNGILFDEKAEELWKSDRHPKDT